MKLFKVEQLAIFMYFSLMSLRLLLISICLCSFLNAFCQQIPKKALQYYNKAMYYKSKKQIEKACVTMQKAIDEDHSFTDAYSALGQWQFEMHQYRASALTFKQASEGCHNGRKDFAKPLARSLIYSGNTTDGLAALSLYTPSPGDKEWRKLHDQAFFIVQAMNKQWRDTAFNIGWRINSKNAELFPFISADTMRFFFTRRMNSVDLDFYFALPDTCGGWLTAHNMGKPLNSPQQELAQTMSADGHYMFMTRCDNRSEDGWDGGGCDLYMSYRVSPDSPWTMPETFGATINTSDYEGMACLSPDNRELYFVSDRPGGYGGKDIWVSSFENGLWMPPRNLGPEINTAGDEMAPFLSIDGKTLYFSSNGLPGMGGSDLFMCRKKGDTLWTRPENMGYPINTPFDEMSQCVTTDGQKIYFASDRDSLAGNYDIYEMHLPEKLQPIKVNYVKGYVYDSLSKGKLNYAGIYVKDGVNGDTLYHFQSNRGDASFMITLPTDKKYALHTDRIGYTEKDDTIFFSKDSLQMAFVHNICMLPSDYQRPIKDTLLLIINFPKNSASITDTDNMLIKKAFDPWMPKLNEITVYINGYTDNSGTPMINESLSYKRAGLVSDAIKLLGVSDASIHSQGWGEANPIAPNVDEENMSKNRRVEIILRYPE